MIHSLGLERRNLHGHFSRDLEPVLTVDPGDTVEIETLAVFWVKSPHEQFEPRRSPEDDGHVLIGPIAVRGARAGMTLATRGMVALMQRERGLDAPEALALASVVVDLRVTQIVNGSVGVHAVLRDDAWQ